MIANVKSCALVGIDAEIVDVERRRQCTARSIDPLSKFARTVADLLGQGNFDAGCLLEAAAFCDVDPTAELAAPV